jgi:hypothetical protein
MPPVVSVHEYVLRPDVDPEEFERALRAARLRGLFDLPGLRDVQFLRTLRGTRGHAYAAIWIYESREAWEALWGAPGDATPTEAYSDAWREWEDNVLARFLDRDPDTIDFAAYEEV